MTSDVPYGWRKTGETYTCERCESAPYVAASRTCRKDGGEMISDEERREIAKAIRDRIWRNERSSWDVVFELSCIDALGRCLSRNKDAALLLADLIDRPTCRNVYDENEMGSCVNGFECSECGNTVEDYEGYRVSGEFNYCSKYAGFTLVILAIESIGRGIRR